MAWLASPYQGVLEPKHLEVWALPGLLRKLPAAVPAWAEVHQLAWGPPDVGPGLLYHEWAWG